MVGKGADWCLISGACEKGQGREREGGGRAQAAKQRLNVGHSLALVPCACLCVQYSAASFERLDGHPVTRYGHRQNDGYSLTRTTPANL